MAAEEQPGPGPDRLSIRLRLRGGTVIWSGLMYPGDDGSAVEEVSFRREQYLAEIERAYAVATAAFLRAMRPRSSVPGEP